MNDELESGLDIVEVLSRIYCSEGHRTGKEAFVNNNKFSL
jgi:hypothetical protein